MSLSLYEISKEFEALKQIIQMDDGEVFEETQELIELAQNLLTEKTDGYVQFVQKLKDEIDLASQHLRRIQAYKKARENAIERLESYAIMCLEKMGEKKIEGTMGSITLRKPSQVLTITDEEKIPDNFASFIRVLDKSQIKEALKKGNLVEGAQLSEGKKSVLIRLKGVK